MKPFNAPKRHGRMLSAADAVARELRARATALANASRTPGDPAAVGGSAPAGAAADLLADLFGQADARAGELAAALDASRCERSYDALIPPKSPQRLNLWGGTAPGRLIFSQSGIQKDKLYYRIRRAKWSIDRAFTTPD